MTVVSEAQVEDQVRGWFAEAWDPELSLVEWRRRLLDAGWAVPSWDRRWFGRGLPSWADRVAHRAILRSGGVALPLGAGAGLAAPTLYDHASDELKEQFLRPTLTGELTWCQLFSEPEAGSDLAGLRCTAEQDGDEWVVNGQKVWNTSAHHADMAILLARSDHSVPKHVGLTYLLLDMRQPGVEVRPIVQMNRRSSFTAVFLTDVRVPLDRVVGQVGQGWAVARGTLAHERSFSTQRNVSFRPEASGRVIDEARAEAEEYLATYEWYPQRMGRPDLVGELARERGRSDDRVLVDEMMRLEVFRRASEWTAARAAAARRLGRPPGAEGSIGKLALSEVARRGNHVHSRLAGARGLLSDGDDQRDAVVAEVLISTPAQSIAGGTDEIQRNIVGETMLGLPREPARDRDVPFRSLLGGTAGDGRPYEE